MTFIIKQKFTFLLLGFVNTAIGYSIYYFFLALDFTVAFALFFSTTLGVLFNYIVYTKWLFGSSVSSSALFRYVIMYLIIYALNVSVVESLHQFFGVSPLLSQILMIPFLAMFTWYGMRLYVYRIKDES